MKRKTIKFTLNNLVIFRLEIAGSEDIVTKLTNDTYFNSMLRDAAEELIKAEIKNKKEELK